MKNKKFLKEAINYMRTKISIVTKRQQTRRVIIPKYERGKELPKSEKSLLSCTKYMRSEDYSDE